MTAHNRPAQRIAYALGEIDGRYIAEAEAYRKKPHTRALRWVALAAALCVLAGSLLIAGLYWPSDRPGKEQSDQPAVETPIERIPPVYEDAYLTAEEVAELFTVQTEGPTQAYTLIYSDGPEALGLSLLPESEYAMVYRHEKQAKPLNSMLFEAYSTALLSQTIDTFSLSMEEAQIDKETEEGEYSISVSGLYDFPYIRIAWYTGRQADQGLSAMRYARIAGSRYKPLTVNRKPLTLDQRQSDAEILASLEENRDVLFALFGQSFDAQKISRSFDGSSEYGATSITVTYYNSTDMDVGNCHDYITLHFNNLIGGVGGDVLYDCTITYRSYFFPQSEYLIPAASCRLLTLAEAEENLYAGYVFGGHSCPLCMASQPAISFDTYDYVSYGYRIGNRADDGSFIVIPMYIFYKDIGDSANGNRIYARTYVSAIRLSGLEEYFAKQTEKHR